ncbi:MAG: patatin-like phospholipase family protein [Clostridia bacterium]|nr:patatin-like phospholipase family protein [Clostridia bacterium]
MKLGLALAGGGIRGIAHAGVLKALEDNNIKVDAIGGTSSGALIASLYSIGYSPYYIYILFKKYAEDIIFFNAKNIVLSLKNNICGLDTGENIEKVYNNLAFKKGIKTMQDIKMPIVIPAVDISESKEYVFTNLIENKKRKSNKYISDISVGKAVRASSSFPAVFCPCEYKSHIFLDGGALDNIPVLEVKKQGVDKVIAVNFKADDIDDNSNIMDITMRTIDIMGNKISERGLKKADFILTIKTDKTGLLDMEKIDSCYKYGYDTTIKNIKKIKELL